MAIWQMFIVLCGFVWATCDFDWFVETLRLDSRRSDKFIDESKEIQVDFFQAKFERSEQSNYAEHCFVVVVFVTVILLVCHYKYQDLKSVHKLLKKTELLQRENKELFEKEVMLHKCIKSAMELSSKNDQIYNAANTKLSNSRKLVSELSKKIDELTKINNSLVNEAMKRTLHEFVMEEMSQEARLNFRMSAKRRAAEDHWYEKKIKRLELENAQLRNKLNIKNRNH